MTPIEAIKKIRNQICNEKDVQRYCRDNCMHGTEHCAYSMAIQALEEIQEYRELGTVEDILKVFNNQREIIAAQHETLKQYRAIGTVEEFKALKEKSVAKKVISFEYQNGHINYGCPICKRKIISKIDGEWCAGSFQEHCDKCGQKLDWK